MRLFRPGFIAGWLYPEAIFRISTDEKVLYLTFDDGPDPESTPEALDILNNYNVIAIFFCIGEAAEKYPYLVEKIKETGDIFWAQSDRNWILIGATVHVSMIGFDGGIEKL